MTLLNWILITVFAVLVVALFIIVVIVKRKAEDYEGICGINHGNHDKHRNDNGLRRNNQHQNDKEKQYFISPKFEFCKTISYQCTGNNLQNSDISENVQPVDYKQHSHRETSARYCRFPRYPPLDCPPQTAASALFPLSDNSDNADTHSRGNRPSGCQPVQ